MEAPTGERLLPGAARADHRGRFRLFAGDALHGEVEVAENGRTLGRFAVAAGRANLLRAD